MNKIFLTFVLFSLALVVRAEPDMDKPLDLKFTAVDGKQVDLAKLRGKVVLIDFWATWCPPCRAEVPNLVAAYKKLHAKGFEILGISLDSDKEMLTAFTKEHEMTWPQSFDGRGPDGDIPVRFGVNAIPAMLLIGKDGKGIALDGSDDLTAQVEKALAAK